MDSPRTTVLIVEDNPGDAAILRRMLDEAAGAGFEVQSADCLAAALQRLAGGNVSVVLLDLSLPDSQGFDTFARLQPRAPHVPIIVLSGQADEELALRIVHEGAQDYVVKGHVDRDLLLRVIRYAIERKQVEEALRESEAFYHALVESMPQNILRKDLQGRFMFANQRCCATFGAPLEQIVGKTDFDFFPRELAEKYRNDDRRVIETREVLETIEEHQKPDGERLYVQVLKSPVCDFSGNVLGIQALFWDVTARKQAEERLRESEQRLQSILDNTTAVIYAKDRGGRYVLINRQYERLFHVTRELVVGKTDYDLFPKEMADAFRANDLQVFKAGRSLEFDEVAPHDDGPHEYISIKFPLRDAASSIYAVCGFSTDITDRKRAEQALLHERYLLHALMDNVPDAIYFKDAQSRFIRINRALASKNGLNDPSEALGKTDFDFFAPEHAAPALADEQEVMRTGAPLVGKEEKETWRDGHESWVLTTKLPFRDESGQIIGTFGISRDITTRKQAEEATRVSERRYRLLTEGTRDAIVVANEQGMITLFNPAAQETFGYSEQEVLGRPLTVLMPEEFYGRHLAGFERYLKTREPRVVGQMVELKGRRKNGEVFPLELSLSALETPDGITFLGAIRDSTERRRMQARVAQTEKLASLGLLSAGLAHEINNPLAYVSNNLAVIERDLRGLMAILAAYEEGHAVLDRARPALATRVAQLAADVDLPYVKQNIARVIESTREGTRRVGEIVQTLRGFARTDQAASERANIHEGISSSLEMIRGRLEKRNITVEQRLGDLPLVACAYGQINQVFLNLLVNALQAIEATERGSGRIEISTRAAGAEVIVEIADDGCGISPEQQSRIFEPFFTTKAVRDGTGLGLSISHSIVTQHNGRIEVESTPGQGSRFRVILPVESAQ